MHTPTRNEAFDAVKQSVRKLQRSIWPASKKPSSEDPVTPFAFRINKTGELRPHSIMHGDDDSPRAYYFQEQGAYKAERRAVLKNRDAILSAGDSDQITLALKKVLDDPIIRPYYTRIVGEKNTEAARVGMEAVEGIKTLVDIIEENKEEGGRNKQCKSLLKNIIMAMLKKDPSHGMKTAIRRQVLSRLSEGASWRLIKTAGVKRKRFEEEDIRKYRAVEEEEDRLKYPEQEILDLQEFMCSNVYTRFSPNVNDTVRKRDRNGDLIKDGLSEDGKQKYLMIRKIFITVGLRELHLLMMKDKKYGGYEKAWQEQPDGSRIARFSKNSLRHYWPNWLKEMSDEDKVICGCSTCLDADDMVEAYNGKRRKLISRTEVELDEMEDTTRSQRQEKEALSNDLKIYKQEILNDDGSHRHERGWTASEQFGCGKRIPVCATHYPDNCPTDCQEVKQLAHYACQSGRCDECISADFTAPKFESER